VREQPVVPEPDRDGVRDPDGVRWTMSRQSISAGKAQHLAEAGAAVAWDPCGCGGYCGFDWFTGDQTAQMVAAGTPTVRNTKRRRGNISLWVSEDERLLVVAEDNVRWGNLLA